MGACRAGHRRTLRAGVAHDPVNSGERHATCPSQLPRRKTAADRQGHSGQETPRVDFCRPVNLNFPQTPSSKASLSSWEDKGPRCVMRLRYVHPCFGLVVLTLTRMREQRIVRSLLSYYYPRTFCSPARDRSKSRTAVLATGQRMSLT